MEKMMAQEPFDNAGQNDKEIRRTRRVGTITCGLLLVLYGVLFLVHIVMPKLDYGIIFELWPVILIFLGVEILVSCTRENQEKRKIIYDFPAVFLIFIVAIFAMIMSAVNYYYDYYGYGSSAYSGSNNLNGTEAVSGTKDFAAKDVNSISLNNEFWDIQVLPSEDNDIHVSYNGTIAGNIYEAANDSGYRVNDSVVQFNQVQNDIVIDIKGNNATKVYTPFFFSSSYKDIYGELALYLPPNDTIDLKLYNESGTMQFKDVSCQGLTLNNSYGNLKIDSLDCAGFDLSNESGEMRIENSNCGKFTLDNKYGDLKVSNTSFAGVSAETESGSLNFNSLLADSLNIKSEYGEVNVKNADSRTETTISNNNGDVCIRYKEKPQDLSFDVKSDYGSIKIGMDNVDYDYDFDTDKKGVIGNGSYHTSIVTENGQITLE